MAILEAFMLGTHSDTENRMIDEGKILVENGVYYLKSTKEVSTGTKGQKAKAGDFFIVDHEGNPCPYDREWFLKNHNPIDLSRDLWVKKIDYAYC